MQFSSDHQLSSADLSRIGETFVNQVNYHRSLASTNDCALELARQADLPLPALVIADEQTGGRGRGANTWWSGRGSLTFSLLFEPGSMRLAQELWPRIGLAAALSVCEALEDAAPEVRCRLKWPNDVQVGGKKICGVLVEAAPPDAALAPRLALGIGINVNASLAGAPDEIRARATSLSEAAGQSMGIGEVLYQTLVWLERSLCALAAGNDALSAAWQSRCALRGKLVQVDCHNRVIAGLCGGIDSAGMLIVGSGETQHRLAGGTIISASDAP